MNNDLISREALKEALKEAHINRTLTFDIATFGCVMNIIDNAPRVDAIVNTIEVRPQGKWIDHSLENLLWGHNECPFCHKRSNSDASYCQYCGARMERAEENA